MLQPPIDLMSSISLNSSAKSQKSLFSSWRKGRILLSRLLVTILTVLLLLVEHASTEHGIKDAVMGALGLVLVYVGIRGRIWASLYIGGRKTSELVTDGPYARTRNPLYFYSGLATIGVAAATGMIVVVAAVALAVWLLSFFTIRAEEEKLLRLHGNIFREYCENVPRLLPSSQGGVEEDLRLFSPLHFHRTCRDALWFLVAWLAVVGIHVLQARNILPALTELH
jgi:protein-S-isoprenylcysteine O-methyltransferase Ste14